MNTTQKFGYASERKAAQLLEKRGYQIIARNYKKRYGEIDLIALEKDTLCFIEVKARVHPQFDMTELIPKSKQKKIITVAKSYIAEHTDGEKACRFDVVLINNTDNHLTIQVIPDAFSEEEHF